MRVLSPFGFLLALLDRRIDAAIQAHAAREARRAEIIWWERQGEKLRRVEVQCRPELLTRPEVRAWADQSS